MRDDSKIAAQPKLDRKQLLGFRNLAAVTTPDSDMIESADLAFCKRGAGEAGGGGPPR